MKITARDAVVVPMCFRIRLQREANRIKLDKCAYS